MSQINISIPRIRNSHNCEDSGLENFEPFAGMPYFIYDFLLAEKKLNSNPPWVFLLRFSVEFCRVDYIERIKQIYNRVVVHSRVILYGSIWFRVVCSQLNI